LNVRELARWLSGAKAAWEMIPGGIPFPTEQEHAEACAALGVRASDASTWSREFLQRLRRDREFRIAGLCAVDGVEAPTSTSADRRAGSAASA
jgi:hypothetical protein